MTCVMTRFEPRKIKRMHMFAYFSYTLPFQTFNVRIESVNTTSMENVSTGVLDENKEHYLRCTDKAKKSHYALGHTIIYVKVPIK